MATGLGCLSLEAQMMASSVLDTSQIASGFSAYASESSVFASVHSFLSIYFLYFVMLFQELHRQLNLLCVCLRGDFWTCAFDLLEFHLPSLKIF